MALNSPKTNNKRTNSCLKIGLLIHNIESTFSDSIITFTAKACAQYSAELIVFPLREIKGNFGVFTYQFWKLYPLITDKNIDALIVISNTQCHFISPENFCKNLKLLGFSNYQHWASTSKHSKHCYRQSFRIFRNYLSFN